MRSRWLALELAALAAAIAAAWWLAGAATTAWLGRVARLGVPAPSPGEVHALARQAAIFFTAGVAALAAGRALGPGARALRRHRGPGGAAEPDPIAVPWLVPAAAVASLFGLALHLATVELSRGAALAPTGAGFAQGFLLGCLAAAALMLAPIDLAQAASRARVPIALAIGGIFAALAVAGSGPAGSGTRINLGPLQPIELVKPLAILFLAAYLGARAPKLRWHRRRLLGLRWPRLELLVPAVGVLLAIVAGLYVIGDLGPVLLLAFVFLGMFYVSSRATGWVVVALGLIALVLAALALAPGLAGGGTVKTRLVMWQDPWTNGLANGYQLGEGLWAMNAGGWTGQGLGHAATPLVPAGKTDLALATLTEQLGAVGLVAYQLALAALVFGALHIAARGRTAERVLIAGGIAILLLAQWLVILGGTLGHLPLTGIVVPFMSAGRSSMVVFVGVVGLVARLATDGRPRAASAELDELHAAARGVRAVSAVLIALALAAGISAAVSDRVETAARGIVARLRDGTLVHRMNPRLTAIAARLRRGAILDRDGAPLAQSPRPGARAYPLGAALGTLLGTHPSRVLLPSWALERRFDERLRGYPERTGGPRDPRGPRGAALPWPDLRPFVRLLDLDLAARDAAIAALDQDLATRSVRTTLDAKLQGKVAALAQAAVGTGRRLAAAAAVLDVDTGHVLARVQVPDYDPGKPAWQDRVLASDAAAAAYKPRFYGAYGEWPDKTGVQGMFQSGSIGKLVTALAAVRAGAADARYTCRDMDAQGPLFTLPGWPKPIHDHTGDRPHGTPDLALALAVSCNVYFGQLGLALGPAPFAALRKDGLDVGYGAALDAGKPGSRQLASTAFGQGAMVMNVVQAARLVAAIAGGGRYVRCPPTLEHVAPCAEVTLVEDPEQLRPILDGMRRVMTAGTGARLTPPAGVRAYGKTGTADVRGFAGEEPFGIAPAAPAAPHSWFVAFAEPASAAEGAPRSPGRLAVAVVVPRGGTGASAAGPLAMQILAAARELGYLQ
ncbi:MAG TPA: FtsW/RodA/SpoVE family cell cycle protein [Kofleriaceae bacterium]|nr:FtsW/RodA/SpoVE family cell cycle protein [Kofleriaceae bacterium]